VRIIVAGPLHAGKTTRVRALVEKLAARAVPLAGYLSPAVRSDDGIAGYDLEAIGTGERAPLLRRAAQERGGAPELTVGSFRFVPAGLERARDIVRGSGPGDLLVVDEVGPAELEGRGVWPALGPLLEDPRRSVLLVVRMSLADAFRRRLGGRPALVRTDEAYFEKRTLAEIAR
jgi:nucleoside-triphosphatase